MPNYRFIAYGDIDALAQSLDGNTAAVILEPVQGEGGVRVPSIDYLTEVDSLCQKNGSLLIVDEIQTGFCRTGPMFVSGSLSVKVDFLTMAKGIAGGFPFGAFAISEKVAQKLELGDHGGTFCGNPLGCAVAYAVIKYLVDNRISDQVRKMGSFTLNILNQWKQLYHDIIVDVRGVGLLLLIEFKDEDVATHVNDECLKRRLFVRQTQETGIRIFPALNIKEEELEEGMTILEEAIETVMN
jgi:acetylornithine/N-succinyldiaminopimelate aminotransferase